MVLFPSEMSDIEVIIQNYTIEYTHCKPASQNYDTCEDFFKRDAENENNHCQCFVLTNLTKNLQGEIVVHCQLEIYNPQESNIDNTSVKIDADDIISNASGQCDPYKTEKTMINETCETIPDSIFKDEFKLYTYNVSTELSEKHVADVNKSLRWSLDENNSMIGLRNKITVLMNSEWLQNEANNTKGLSAGPYLLYLYRFYRNENIVRRYLILSTTREVVHVTYRSTVIDIIALALGLVLLAASIALFALRNRILGIESNTSTLVAAAEPTANNRQSRTQPEERPLSAPVNNEYL
ncbi:uncharacterized protein LOC123870871 isoform X2 [Maniola jurtina]|nr:uncharacterized protein LOC123870871 isoform X2 [Maniola jurtina]